MSVMTDSGNLPSTIVDAVMLAILVDSICVAADSYESGVKLEFWKGHFNRGGLPFHNWDREKEIPAACARCHGANSLPEFLKEGKNAPAPHAKNGFACTN